jgi:glycosyltransferase involved in cell wall biosynthesis
VACPHSREVVLFGELINPLVSIITPAYNHEAFMMACIESVLKQTYPHWEQIIIDDGSTDRTLEVVRRYADPRIHLVEQPHRGIEALAATYNRALSEANGDLIAILEGDDLWPADKLATMMPIFQDLETILAFGEVQDVDESGALAKRRSRTSRRRARLPRSILFNDPVLSSTPYLLSVSGQTFIAPSTVVIRRDALEAIGGFQDVPGKCPVDVPTFARLSLMGKFHYVPKLLGYRRHHLGSATVQYLDIMTNAARGFALDAAADPLFCLTLTERKSVEEGWRAVHFAAEFWLGRICLVRGLRKEARKHFAAAMKAGEALLVCASAMGWGLSWLHSDMEGFARLAGRATLLEE